MKIGFTKPLKFYGKTNSKKTNLKGIIDTKLIKPEKPPKKPRISEDAKRPKIFEKEKTKP